jgi:uncharacterized ferritin-like protein (DUF455 family)
VSTQGFSDIQSAARACLEQTDPVAKCAMSHAVAQAWRDGVLPLRVADADVDADSGVAGRPARPQLVSPRALSQRGLGTQVGRAAFIHAIAHIEFNAINLAWDAVARFDAMPPAFYADWIDVADDEARHFAMLERRLATLGHAYGDFDAHDGLWEMAVRTAHSCLERMALVPRVLEARGLDVTPAMVTRLRAVGDTETAEILELILREEVAHVATGSRWFRWCCERDGVDPDATFEVLLRRHAGPALRGPFNRDARLAAGFSEHELTLIERVTERVA